MHTTEMSSDTENIIPFPSTLNTKVEYHPTVHDLPSDERPRERLQNHGPQALSNAELLAIILRTGTTRNNVIELAGILLSKFGGLEGLMRAVVIRALSIALSYVPLKSTGPQSYVTVLQSSFAITTQVAIPPHLRKILPSRNNLSLQASNSTLNWSITLL